MVNSYGKGGIMNRNMAYNFLAIAPLALWSYISVGLSRIKNGIAPESRVDLAVIHIVTWCMFVCYYILSMLFHRKNQISGTKYTRYSVVCLATGSVFSLVSFFVL